MGRGRQTAAGAQGLCCAQTWGTSRCVCGVWRSAKGQENRKPPGGSGMARPGTFRMFCKLWAWQRDAGRRCRMEVICTGGLKSVRERLEPRHQVPGEALADSGV